MENEAEKNERCEKCLFWNYDAGTYGECRRYPPQFVSIGDAEETWCDERFPCTSPNQWCGEYKGKLSY